MLPMSVWTATLRWFPITDAGVTTPLSILAHAGMECTHEFHAIHRVYPIAYRQLAAYFIGDLNLAGADQMPSVA